MKLLLRCALLSFVPAALAACTAWIPTEPRAHEDAPGSRRTRLEGDTAAVASGGGEAGTTSSEGEAASTVPGIGTLGSGN
jgi:hypothetical protein